MITLTLLICVVILLIWLGLSSLDNFRTTRQRTGTTRPECRQHAKTTMLGKKASMPRARITPTSTDFIFVLKILAVYGILM